MNKYLKFVFICFNMLLFTCFVGCEKDTNVQKYNDGLTERDEITLTPESNSQGKSLDEILIDKGLKIENIIPNYNWDKMYHITEYELYSEEPFIIKVYPGTISVFSTSSYAYITEDGNVLISMDGIEVEVIGPKGYKKMLTFPTLNFVKFCEYLEGAEWSYHYTFDKNNDRVLINDIIHDEDDLYFESEDLEITINGYTVHYNYKMCEFKNTDDNPPRTLATYASCVEVKNNLVFKCTANYYGKSFIENLPTPEEVLAGLYESILPIE